MNYENKIKLNAFTNDDLKILSYLCQDAILSNEEFSSIKIKSYLLLLFHDIAGKKKKILILKVI